MRPFQIVVWSDTGSQKPTIKDVEVSIDDRTQGSIRFNYVQRDIHLIRQVAPDQGDGRGFKALQQLGLLCGGSETMVDDDIEDLMRQCFELGMRLALERPKFVRSLFVVAK